MLNDEQLRILAQHLGAHLQKLEPSTHKPWCFSHKGLNCTCGENREPQPDKTVERKTCLDCVFYQYYKVEQKAHYRSRRGDCYNQPPLRNMLKGGDIEWIRPRVFETDPMCERGKI